MSSEAREIEQAKAATADADALAAELALARADAVAAQDEADAAAAALVQAQGDALESSHAAAEASKTAQDALSDQVGALTLELNKERSERAQEAQAHALATAQHEAAQAALRSELDRLVNQLADLRAALARPAAQG